MLLAGCSGYRPGPGRLQRGDDPALPARRRRQGAHHRVRAGKPDQHLPLSTSPATSPFPLIGRGGRARGSTVQQLEATIAGELRKRLPCATPERVGRDGPLPALCFVMGEVGAAGQYFLRAGDDRAEGDRRRPGGLTRRAPTRAASTSPATINGKVLTGPRCAPPTRLLSPATRIYVRRTLVLELRPLW